MAIKSMSEILREIATARTEEQKLELLRYYDNPNLRTLLSYTFDPRVKWLLPEGVPPFKHNELVDQHGRLYSEIRKLYIFCDPTQNIPQMRREKLFIELLESIDPDDAMLLCSCKDKKLPWDGIDGKLLNKRWPGFIWEPPQTEPQQEVKPVKAKKSRKPKKEEPSGTEA